jgi:hypothetical protein
LDPYNRLNDRPNFKQSGLPCDGKVGDVVIITPLDEPEHDKSKDGVASVWICIKASWGPENEHAVWARVQFDGVATCGRPVALPPQNHVSLFSG